MGKWRFRYSQPIKTKLSDGYGGEPMAMAAQFGYDHREIRGYLGYVGPYNSPLFLPMLEKYSFLTLRD
jgi:hypothetical protein